MVTCQGIFTAGTTNIFSYSTRYHAAGKLRRLIYVYYKHSLNVIIRAAFCHDFYHSINLHFTMYLLLSKCMRLIRGLKWINYVQKVYN